MSASKKELEKERQKVIKLYLSGQSISSICDKLNRSRKWFYKWKKRYENKASQWYKSESRAPKNPDSIDSSIEDIIIKVRKELMEDDYAQIGAQVIAWKLKNLGVENIPSLSTINRIIKRNDLTVQDSEYEKKGTDYPNLPIWFPNSIHEVDFWGAKYITGGTKFYVFNVMDIYSRSLCSIPAQNKGSKTALDGLFKAWKVMNEPDFIKLDNALQFRGSNKHPGSLVLLSGFVLKRAYYPSLYQKFTLMQWSY